MASCSISKASITGFSFSFFFFSLFSQAISVIFFLLCFPHLTALFVSRVYIKITVKLKKINLTKITIRLGIQRSHVKVN